jgi:hypothetical protein
MGISRPANNRKSLAVAVFAGGTWGQLAAFMTTV